GMPRAESRAPQPSAPSPAVANIPYADARPIFESLKDNLLPADLKAMTPEAREASWPRWVAAYDSSIRARLDRGDEDSVVNFLLYGTAFTKQPRATEAMLAALASQNGAAPDVVVRRIDDLITAIQAPGTNERLQFVRQLVERRKIDASAPG